MRCGSSGCAVASTSSNTRCFKGGFATNTFLLRPDGMDSLWLIAPHSLSGMAQLSTLDGWSFVGAAGLFFLAVAVTVHALFRLLERLARPFRDANGVGRAPGVANNDDAGGVPFLSPIDSSHRFP